MGMTVSASDITTQLAQVNAAIAWLLGGSGAGSAGAPTAEFWEGGDRWRGVDLGTLFKERGRLEVRLADLETGGSSFSLIEVADV